ncbi:MAG: hypothetical protein EA344_02315 [Alkalicoccus sp.]|nr:MAG: hypothetical protein EA344_02315 [Alkalicoccus sp.]
MKETDSYFPAAVAGITSRRRSVQAEEISWGPPGKCSGRRKQGRVYLNTQKHFINSLEKDLPETLIEIPGGPFFILDRFCLIIIRQPSDLLHSAFSAY